MTEPDMSHSGPEEWIVVHKKYEASALQNESPTVVFTGGEMVRDRRSISHQSQSLDFEQLSSYQGSPEDVQLHGSNSIDQMLLSPAVRAPGQTEHREQPCSFPHTSFAQPS